MTSFTSNSRSSSANFGPPDGPRPNLPPGPDVKGTPIHRDPAAITLLVAAVAIVTIAMFRTDSVVGRNPSWYWMGKVSWAETPRPQIILAGDSRVMRGLDPSAFDELRELPVANVGFSSARLSSPYLDYLEALIGPEPKGSIVVFGMSPFTFSTRAVTGTGFTVAKRGYDRLRLPLWLTKRIHTFY